jgi:LuxR family maltose regulon positive regulatory protein
MEEARRAAERALELESRLGGGPSLVWKSNLYSALAMIHRGRRRYGAAARAAEAAIQEYGALVPERALISLQYQKGYIHWLRGEIHDLRQLYAHMKESKYVGPGMNAPLKLLEGLVELSADHRRPAERALRKAVSDGQKVHMAYPFGSPRLQLAHAYWKWDRPEEALAQFTPLLRKCAQRRMAGRILMEAEPALPLLELCVETGVEREFSEELLGKLSAAGTPQAVWVPETDEALTPRQLEVLDLLATGATNKEIAEALVISVHTVKRHVSDILSRMNVSTRTEAAARARELGML